MIVTRQTIWLSRAHRGVVDQELADRLGQLGDRQVEVEARKIGYRLDPEAFVARARRAEADRHVSLRPAPDMMARLSALLPLSQGVACYAALRAAADTAPGQASPEAVPVQINLVMSDATLLAGSSEPAQLDDYGPIPAPLARRLALNPDQHVPIWIRRLFRHPRTGELAAMESRRRCFSPAQRQFIRIRDGGVCRTPYCGAPIRHTDHVQPANQHGPTTVANGAGLCQACNHTKQAPGWTTTPISSPDQRHQTHITTPAGHHYYSRAPDPPRSETEWAVAS